MRALLLAALLLLPAAASVPAGAGADGPQRAGGTCGRPDYPSATKFDPAFVVNASLWRSFQDGSGFAGGGVGTGAVEVRVTDGGTVHVVRLGETQVRSFVGGTEVSTTEIVLRVADEESGRVVSETDLKPLSLGGGRAGGNLTVAAHAIGGSLAIFWRWAYLPCAEDFPNTYYVFHAQLAGGRVTDDNTLVYFEAPRPSRGPPSDLILLVAAGLAVTVIFLLARRALKKDA